MSKTNWTEFLSHLNAASQSRVGNRNLEATFKRLKINPPSERYLRQGLRADEPCDGAEVVVVSPDENPKERSFCSTPVHSFSLHTQLHLHWMEPLSGNMEEMASKILSEGNFLLPSLLLRPGDVTFPSGNKTHKTPVKCHLPNDSTFSTFSTLKSCSSSSSSSLSLYCERALTNSTNISSPVLVQDLVSHVGDVMEHRLILHLKKTNMGDQEYITGTEATALRVFRGMTCRGNSEKPLSTSTEDDVNPPTSRVPLKEPTDVMMCTGWIRLVSHSERKLGCDSDMWNFPQN
ncbi:hypothetical protein F7725_028954 [Dissostichus mawsoni]|uniref:Uncharacterized protein n=1 Tax=Dissostichus mawsoni TaxID=36200 RepID=A0A7J5XH31_DISMA|nr:hypothetical protein F7725_028954 [Dissostichus mawsoni]